MNELQIKDVGPCHVMLVQLFPHIYFTASSPPHPSSAGSEGVFLFPPYCVYFMSVEMQMLTRRLTCHLRAKDALQNALHTYLTVVHLWPALSPRIRPSVGHMYKIYICLPYHVCHLSFGPMSCS